MSWTTHLKNKFTLSKRYLSIEDHCIRKNLWFTDERIFAECIYHIWKIQGHQWVVRNVVAEYHWNRTKIHHSTIDGTKDGNQIETMLAFTMLRANSADNKLMIFLSFFLEKRILTLHANCLLRRQFAWNVKSYFLGKIKKYFKMLSVEIFTQLQKVS